MNKSISELAKELNVSRQAIYQRIRNDEDLSTKLCQFTVKQGNTKVYTLQGQELIKQAFDKSVNVNSKPSIDSKPQSIDSKLIDTLTRQLEQKDRQIEEKDRTINKLLDQIDKLTTALNAAQVLHGLDKQQEVIEVKEAAAPDQTQVFSQHKKNTGSGQQDPVRRRDHHSRKSERRQQSVFQNIIDGFKNRFR